MHNGHKILYNATVAPSFRLSSLAWIGNHIWINVRQIGDGYVWEAGGGEPDGLARQPL